MPRYIIKIQEFYLEWSSIVDAPITYGMPLDEFKEYYQEKYGKMNDLTDRLERVDKKGTSAYHYTSAQDTIEFNRAGKNETELTLDKIFTKYCIGRPKEQAL